MSTYSMSTNFNCDHETALEGEDREILALIYETLNGALKSIETMRHVVHSKLAQDCLAILEPGLSELMHDASLKYCVDQATDSAREARVVLVVRPKVAMAGASERLDADSMKLGSAAE